LRLETQTVYFPREPANKTLNEWNALLIDLTDLISFIL